MTKSMTHADIVVAGHICLDLIPTFPERAGKLDTVLVPGKLVHIGPAVTATGGAVSNTGLSLYRLGIATKLMGKIGSDLFGEAVLNVLRTYDDSLTQGMIVSEEDATAYTLVISLPGVDRILLHCPGVNASFCADDVDMTHLEGAKIFHFGYPPIMPRMYLDEGAELVALLRRAKTTRITTSVDMSYPDPDSEAGQVDWDALLTRILPYVDLFLPSFDEILFMLDRPRLEAINASRASTTKIDDVLLHELAGRLLDMGAAIVGLKLGDQGLYLRTTSSAERLVQMGASTPQDVTGWLGRELLSPCFQANLVGTTGAGDCTIAGFLAGFVQHQSVEDVMTSAVAVGGFNVESPDATSGIPNWETVQARIQAGWERLETTLALNTWRWDAGQNIWVSPRDTTYEEE